MKFLDQAKIFVKSGDGGNGCVSFLKEKYIEFGGPDGGNGGDGGDIIFESSSALNTLVDFRYQQHFKAPKGENGSRKSQRGKNAAPLTLKVPQGTQILDPTKTVLLKDLNQPSEKFVFLKGGRGGRGNESYKSSTNRSPRQFTVGEKGQEMWVWLCLKLIADVGLIGFPNAGKSTFLSLISGAKPKVAAYAFTTLHPQLGVVRDGDREFVLADLPGLIEDAHQGKGLGIRFLGHAERCSAFLHFIDASSEDVVGDFQKIEHELASYDKALIKKTQLVVLNKADLVSVTDLAKKKALLEEKTARPVYTLSNFTKEGLASLLDASYRSLASQ